MEISSQKKKDYAIVRVKGRIIKDNQIELRKALEGVIEDGAKGIALDFDQVEYLDSSGLGCCAAIYKILKEKQLGALVMFGASPNIEKMWKLIRLELIIPILKNESEALATLEAGA